ncbi:hypothetical protein ABZ252_03435 [Streptomyces sp. NPDC006175]|uniref:hypothetical protein n=1 Tax=Streptomyces sp. NPDC006175 TaxID=3154471 RepID=UPI0033B3F96D
MANLERIAEIVAYYRALDERSALRHYFRHEDEEGGRWYSEAVPDRGELIFLKQAELTSAGQFHRYSWEHLEDERGGLTDQAIDPELDPLEAIPAKSSNGRGTGERVGHLPCKGGCAVRQRCAGHPGCRSWPYQRRTPTAASRC